METEEDKLNYIGWISGEFPLDADTRFLLEHMGKKLKEKEEEIIKQLLLRNKT